MLKKVILFFCLLNTGLSSADTIVDNNLKIYGRALANYQLCAQLAGEQSDNTMHSYYAEMAADTLAASNTYSARQSAIIFKEFKRSKQALAEIDKLSMGQLCLSRFDPLSRKMQELQNKGR